MTQARPGRIPPSLRHHDWSRSGYGIHVKPVMCFLLDFSRGSWELEEKSCFSGLTMLEEGEELWQPELLERISHTEVRGEGARPADQALLARPFSNAFAVPSNFRKLHVLL